MGCVESRPDINDIHADIFTVVTVDDRGRRHRPARLQVTDTHIVLHQRGRAPIRWPLRCLRRYGFDAERFSFESGRRCPTGPGIYNFKCRRAEALFNTLQQQIQNIAEESLPNIPYPIEQSDIFRTDLRVDHGGYLEPLPHLESINSLGNVGIGVLPTSTTPGIGVNSNNGVPSPPTPLTPPPGSLYINSHIVNEDIMPRAVDPGSTEILPISSSAQENITREPPATPNEPSSRVSMDCVNSTVIFNHKSNNYMNINNKPSYESDYMQCDDIVHRPLYINVGPDPRDHLYENFDIEKDNIPVVPPRQSFIKQVGGSESSHSGTTTTTDTDHQHQQINYILIDFEKSSDSSQVVPLSPPGSVASVPVESPHRITPSGYATIDFAKTAALRDTATAVASGEVDGEGSRKTRHNSSFAFNPNLNRHNSSLSD